MDKIRVLLAEDHILVRKGLRALLENRPSIEVVAEADDGRQAVHLADQLKPDVVLMDFSMPGLNGLEATRQIHAQVPGTRILMLTRHANQEYAERALQAGVSGYLVKKSAPEELILAIHTVHDGEIYLDAAVSAIIVPGFPTHPKPKGENLYNSLTTREREMLQLIAEGRANREIAALLSLSVKTVENHRVHLMEKLRVHSTAELTQFAIRLGIIRLDE